MKRTLVIIWGSVILSLFSTINIFANDVTALFQKGVESYQAGNFHESIEAFKEIINSGVENFEIYYNLGNANYKINKIPEAIYYYEKALMLRPGNDDILYNLNLCKLLLKDKIYSVPEPFFTLYLNRIMKTFHPDGWAIISHIVLLLFLLSFILFLLNRAEKIKSLLLALSIVFLFSFAFSMLIGYRHYHYMNKQIHAIVLPPTIGLKSSPSESSADIHIVHEGLKVKITTKLGEWYEIIIPDGNKGWVKAEDLKKF